MHKQLESIAVFGGAFDPPHVGHLGIISAILNASAADRVLLVPSGERADKTHSATTEHRLRMLEIFRNENFGTESAVAIEDGQARGQFSGSFTVELMSSLRQRYPKEKLAFVIGSDLIRDLPDWKDSERLKKEVSFLVVPRPEYSLENPHGFMLSVIDKHWILPTAVSSTAVRSLLAAKKKTAGFLSPAVSQYILTHRLYGA